MNDDFADLLRALLFEDARFLIVGAHAMAVHGVPRATGDIDVWVRADADNAHRVWAALSGFGAPLDALTLRASDLERAGNVWQIGVPPRRIDILTAIDGVEFDEAWSGRHMHRIGDLEVPFLGLGALRINKAATGRAKDVADLELLDEAAGERSAE